VLIEVAYAEALRAIVKTYEFAAPATVADALARAADDPDFAGVDVRAAVGIFGRIVGVDAALRDGDRVEIYRAMREDPKSARRRRAAASKSARS